MQLKAADSFEGREFPMTNQDFSVIQEQAYRLTGIKLTDHKKNMIYGRLSRRLRKLSISSFSDYCALIQSNDSSEITSFVNAITTNLTAFFRESHHFDFLKETVFPSLLHTNSSNKRIRIWSAGCSTGEEPYSLAMVVKSFHEFRQWDVKILATDLDSNVVNTASQGVYATDRIEKVPDVYERFLQRSKNQEDVRVKPDVASIITFKQLNLLHRWPIKGPFDIIFCRNVVIYFDVETQRKLFDRYADVMANQGHLFIGHSENLHNITDRFTSIGRTIYQKNINKG